MKNLARFCLVSLFEFFIGSPTEGFIRLYQVLGLPIPPELSKPPEPPKKPSRLNPALSSQPGRPFVITFPYNPEKPASYPGLLFNQSGTEILLRIRDLNTGQQSENIMPTGSSFVIRNDDAKIHILIDILPNPLADKIPLN